MMAARVHTRPYPPLVRRTVRRSAAIWLGLRVGYALVLVLAGSQAGLFPLDQRIAAALQPVLFSRVLLVGLAAALAWLDRRHAHEHVLEANFGVTTLWFWAPALLSALGLDICTHALLRAI